MHAVVVVEPGVDSDHVVREANARLQDHQRIRTISVWPGPQLTRTEARATETGGHSRLGQRQAPSRETVPQGDSLER